MKTAIYHIRTRCNYSQSMAAREIGVSRQMFSAWEHGDKPIPDIRKKAISALFGVPVSILEEADENMVLAFCDRPMFTTTCQGKQVFSFLPPKKQARVFLGVPTATRPEEQCKILMSQKADLLEKIDRLFQFEPQRQVDELPDMELKLSVLSRFSSVADAAEAVKPQYRGRLLRFILEQMEILSAMLQGTEIPEPDTWAQQQLHLLRYRWGQINALPDGTSTDEPGHNKNCEPEEILFWNRRMSMNWIELHTDTYASEQLSFLDGAQIVSLCGQNGCTAVACTDRNSILSYLPMEREAEHRGIQLIYGVTLDCVDLDDRYAITLLAKNEAGRRNIFALMRLLEGNQFPFGHCVTRQQVEIHREGLLLGASAIDGQLTRAIQLRRGTRRLKQIAAGYDYLELPLEPYDTAAQLLQLSKEISTPLCAVRSARLDPNPSEAEIHAFQAISYDMGLNERPSPYLSPKEVAEHFRARYVLPGERQGLEQALSQGQAQVMAQIEPLEPLRHLLNQNAEVAELERQKWLRAKAEAALLREYGDQPALGIVQRFNWELERSEQLGMAGQILLMQEITKVVREAGGRVSVAGTWNSSFLLYLLDITELNPLPTELDPKGIALCPASLLGTGKPLLSADMRLSENFISLAREKVTQKYKRQFLQIEHVVRETGSEAEVCDLIERYLNDCCPKETVEILKEDGSFYYITGHNSSRVQCHSPITSLYLLPETADPSALPVTLDAPEGALNMVSTGLEQMSHIPCVRLLGSSAQSVLARCAASTGVPFQEIPLDDETVYAALGEAYRSGDAETPMAAACELLGSSVNQFDTELFHAVGFTDLRSLIRFMSLCHGTGVWQDNQQTLLQNEEICPEQVITCREDVYRYLLERGASASEAADFMERIRMGRIARLGYSEPQWELLKKCGAEDWFVQACKKIQYLFPEGYSAEYAVSLVRLVWYVLHYPEAASMVLEERSTYRA